ncbi:immunoglobulin lambda-like polypeptide 1 [Acanthochromis polyacanthus]|uniref:immunoglobulin lambda-like polypeptide 1 n=1 Tax=Acanthochromis polyacanthus TaxID=80966 RepID=UPI0022344BAD|nr:immunoglobulin lambda-like polypeptide 1 [Acanthochromis polyacanthus]
MTQRLGRKVAQRVRKLAKVTEKDLSILISSLFGLSCITAPLVLSFSRGNTTAQDASPPSCCSVLSVFSAGCHGSTADSGRFDFDLETNIQQQVFVRPFFTVGGKLYLIFGSGTKLYVTDEQVVKPVVSVYPAASRVHLEGSSSLLCLASAMFPPLVRFSWKRQKEDGQLEDVDPAEAEQLEIREPGRSASILLIHQQQDSTYKYSCYVQHEEGPVEAQTQQELPAPAASCPPEREPADLPALQQAHSSFQVNLLCLLSTVLIVKSLVFCCGLSLLMILTNKGPSTNCTHAD